MPLVILSTDDEAILQLCQQMAARNGEKLYRLEPGFFHDANEEKMRVTFIGHAGAREYGQQKLNPKEFYDLLVKLQFPFDKVSQIDLHGCEIGFRKDGASTYLTEFARCIYANPMAQAITVKGFTDLVLPEDSNLGAMFVGSDDKVVKLLGVKKENLAAYQKAMAEEKNFSNSRMTYHVYQHGVALLDINMGIRPALDSNENFSLNFDIYTKQQKFSKYRLQCWAEINNRIAYINQTVSPSDIKTQMLFALNEAKKNLEDINQDLLKITYRLTDDKVTPPLLSNPQIKNIKLMQHTLQKNQEVLNRLKDDLKFDTTLLLSGINAETINTVIYRLLDTHSAHPAKSKVIEFIIQNTNSFDSIELNKLLSKAIANESIDVIEILIKSGKVHPNQFNPEGQTLLTRAIENGNLKVVEALLKYSIGPHAIVNPDQANQGGWTPLALAVNKGYIEIVIALLQTGKVKIDQVVNALGWTPLSIAAKQGHVGIVQMLKAAQLRDFYLAIEQGNVGVVKKLLETLSSDAVNQPDSNGAVPLLLAAAHGYAEIVRLLIEKEGVYSNPVNSFGNTPLWMAAANGHQNVIDVLFEKLNSDAMHQPNSIGVTPLQVAVQNGHLNIANAFTERLAAKCLEEIANSIKEKNSGEWKLSGGYSKHTIEIEGKSMQVPGGVKAVWDIIHANGKSSVEKMREIMPIVDSRQGSSNSLGLFDRSQAIQTFYKDAFKKIEKTQTAINDVNAVVAQKQQVSLKKT